jgi:WbqC-like protein
MIVAIHQPHYLPWLRYLHKMASCDVFVVLDDTQYEKNGWQNRNKIKGPNGPVLLTVPVRDPSFKRICDVEINSQAPWGAKHWKSLLMCYGKAPYFRRYASIFEHVLATPWDRLAPLNERLLRDLAPALGITSQIVLSSGLDVPGTATERLIGICRRLGAHQYLTGAFAAGNHLDSAVFADAGIELAIQEWVCPTYGQQFPAQGFLPELSVVDLLFNEGPRSLESLMAASSARRSASATRA